MSAINTIIVNKKQFRNKIKLLLLILSSIILIGITVGVTFFAVEYRDGLVSKRENEKNTATSQNSQLIENVNQIKDFSDQTQDLIIIPGTKWCGLGGTARSYDDLGLFRETDKCCRAHDECSEYIMAGETNYGLKNIGSGTLMNCNCNEKFYKCLKDTHHIFSDIIGFAFFTVLGTKCFKKDFPIIKCDKCVYTTFAYKKRDRKRCVRYVLDESKPKKYQIFDGPIYP